MSKTRLLSVDETVKYDEKDAPMDKPVSFTLADRSTVRLGIEEAYRLGWNLVRATINRNLSVEDMLACCFQQLTDPEGNPGLTIPKLPEKIKF